MQTVILAGGKGTRLRAVLGNKPKCLATFGETCILGHQLDDLSRNGSEEVLIITCHGSDEIQEYIERNRCRYPEMKIRVFVEEHPGGTAGALKSAYSLLADHFVLLMGDLITDFGFRQLFNRTRELGSLVNAVVKFTDHPFDSDLVEIHGKETLHKFHTRNADRSQPMCGKILPLGNSGIFCLSKYFVEHYCDHIGDIHDALQKALSAKNTHSERFNCYFTTELIRDMGTEERLNDIHHIYLNRRASQVSSNTRMPAVFIDKDNTLITDYENRLHSISSIRLIRPGLVREIRELANNNRLFIITNQPGIAKGYFSQDEVMQSMYELLYTLWKAGITVNDFTICPHHPESGHVGEISSLKFQCDCRKPSQGMVNKLTERWNTNLTESIVIGDSWRDMKLAEGIGCVFIDANSFSISE